MLASMEKPQKQMVAKASVTRIPTQRPIEINSPHSHSGPNFPLCTWNKRLILAYTFFLDAYASLLLALSLSLRDAFSLIDI